MSKYGRARARMTMRAAVERFTSAGTDSSGDPTGSWASLASVPCWVLESKQDPVLDEERQRYIENFVCMVPIGTDITTEDRVAQITDRNSTPTKLYGHTDSEGADVPILIDGVNREKDHLRIQMRQEETAT